jgi:hypothetical protein
MRNRPDATVATTHRAMVGKRLKTAVFYAVVAGADMLSMAAKNRTILAGERGPAVGLRDGLQQE